MKTPRHAPHALLATALLALAAAAPWAAAGGDLLPPSPAPDASEGGNGTKNETGGGHNGTSSVLRFDPEVSKKTVLPGGNATHTFRLTYNGTGSARILINASEATAGWKRAVSPESVRLRAGESATVTLEVVAPLLPLNGTASLTSKILVNAVLARDPDEKAHATAVTRILLP